ncbi:MAG TPA: hypothetical protein VE909_03725 [Xanthobacteraceae bacterium]|nr:hypothetical protein [Xanthobacteraceae bacterium]
MAIRHGLVIASPSPMAVEAERSLILLSTRIVENRVLTSPKYGALPASCGAPLAATGPVISK